MHGSAHSLASFHRRRGTICSANGGGYPFPLRQYTSQQKRFIHKKEPLSSASAPYADRMKADGTRHRLSFYPVSHTSHVHGGSVSRRGLNQPAGNRAHLAWAHKSAGKVKPIPSYSSGGGPGEGLLLEKPPPPEFPNRPSRCTGRGGSVSRRDHNQAYRRKTALSGGTNYAEATTSNASRSSGGSARRGKTAIAASGG